MAQYARLAKSLILLKDATLTDSMLAGDIPYAPNEASPSFATTHVEALDFDDMLLAMQENVMAYVPPPEQEEQEVEVVVACTNEQLRAMAGADAWLAARFHSLLVGESVYQLLPTCNGDCCMLRVDGQAAFSSGACRLDSQRESMLTHMCKRTDQHVNKYVDGVYIRNKGPIKAAAQGYEFMNDARTTSKRLFGQSFDFIHMLFITPALALTALGHQHVLLHANGQRAFAHVVLASRAGASELMLMTWEKMLHFRDIGPAYAASMAAEFRHMFPGSEATVDDRRAALFRIVHMLQLCKTQLSMHAAEVVNESNSSCFITLNSFNIIQTVIAEALNAVAADVPGTIAGLQID